MYASQKSAAALAAGKPLVDATGKELKPTLSSGPVRTRKRNIQTKRDPEAFRNRLLEVFDEAVRFHVHRACACRCPVHLVFAYMLTWLPTSYLHVLCACPSFLYHAVS